jgi:hypothetical protein
MNKIYNGRYKTLPVHSEASLTCSDQEDFFDSLSDR